MLLARVRGPVYSVIHHPAYSGRTLMCVVPADADGEMEGRGFLAVDLVGSGRDDLVLVGQPPGYAAEVFGLDRAPIRSLILARIDDLDIGR